MKTKLMPHFTRTVSLLASTAVFAPGALLAQTTSQQSTAEQCPDGSIPPKGQACPPGTQTGDGTPTAGTDDGLPTSGTVEEDDIVVTGSRIARRGRDTIEPILVLDSAQIETRGFSTLGQALNECPPSACRARRPSGPGNPTSDPGKASSTSSDWARSAR